MHERSKANKYWESIDLFLFNMNTLSIYDTLELASHSAFRYYTAGNRRIVIDPATGVHDGNWKPVEDKNDYVDFVIATRV